MVVMTVEQVDIYTVADLERERGRDDRLRWELLDGELVVTPSPRPIHQSVLGRLHLLVAPAVDDELEVYLAPLDVQLSERTVLQPDLLIIPRSDVTEEGIFTAPILAVEILSPSTRHRDLVTKLGILQRAGCPHYWVLDPADESVRIFELAGDAYRLVTHARGAEDVTVRSPVEMTFSMRDLLPR